MIHRSEPIRVLYVVDSIFWVTGTLARSFSDAAPWIEPTICSTPILLELLDEDPGLVDRVDLVHVLDPWGSKRVLPRVKDRRPSVASVYHVEEWSQLSHNAQANALMVISEEWERRLLIEGLPREFVRRVPLGVDVNLFAPPTPRERADARRRSDVPADSFAVGVFGRNTPATADRKGVDVLIEALAQLRTQEVGELTLLLVGPGWSDTMTQVRQLGVHCRWVPFVLDHSDLGRYYQALDVYLVPSRVEGGPAPLLEAMATGLPCVASAVGMAPEVLEDGVNGFLASPGDAAELARRAVALARDEGLRRKLGDSARSTVIGGYQWVHSSELLSELYELAISRFGERETSEPAPNTRHSATQPVIRPRSRRPIRMKEYLYWLRRSALRQDPKVAFSLCFRAWRANPFSARPWLEFLKSHLRS